MTTPSQPSVPSITAIDAGWGELLDGLDEAPTAATAPAEPAVPDEPRHHASATLARMASMMDAREGTGPVFDLRAVPGPRSRPANAPEIGAPVAEVHEDASLDVSEVALLELGAPAEILDDVPVVVDAVPPRPVIRAAAAPPVVRREPPPRTRPWWAIAAGAMAVVVLAWWSLRPSGDAPTAENGAAAIQPRAVVPDAAPTPVAEPRPAPATSAPTPTPEPEPEILANADAPAIAQPVADAPVADAPIEGASVIDARAAFDAGRFDDAHAIAHRLWSATRDNDALQLMVSSACALDDGMLARDAFRSLSGPQTRATVYVECRRRGIDLRARTKGYTAGELLTRARRAATAGDHDQARALARESLAIARTAEAMIVVAVSACRLGKLDEARRVASLLHRDEQAELRASCSAAGVEL